MSAYRLLFRDRAGLDVYKIKQLGEEIGHAVARWWPDAVAEIEALAAGAGQDPLELMAINGRTEIFAAFAPPERRPPECSVIGWQSNQQQSCLLGQNWDYHPSVAPGLSCWDILDVGGRRMLTLTEAGILAKIGVNNRRLACGVNAMASASDGQGVGVPIHVALRRVLQEADTLTDALEILSSARSSASFCVTLAYAEGERGLIVSVEMAPGRMRLVWPDESGVLVHTNHFLSNQLATQDTGLPVWIGSAVRFHTLHSGMRSISGDLQPAHFKDLLCSHFNWPDSVCSHRCHEPLEKDDYATLASIVLDLGNMTVEIVDGPPCANSFQTVQFAASSPSRAPVRVEDDGQL